jgi:hypothetical protein
MITRSSSGNQVLRAFQCRIRSLGLSRSCSRPGLTDQIPDRRGQPGQYLPKSPLARKMSDNDGVFRPQQLAKPMRQEDQILVVRQHRPGRRTASLVTSSVIVDSCDSHHWRASALTVPYGVRPVMIHALVMMNMQAATANASGTKPLLEMHQPVASTRRPTSLTMQRLHIDRSYRSIFAAR